MFRGEARTVVILVSSFVALASLTRGQEAAQSEREAMYYRYLEFPSYVKGGSVTPHWMADGSSFWYAEGAPANTVIYKVDPKADPSAGIRAGTKSPLFDAARLRQALTRVLGHDPPYQRLPFEEFTFVDGEKAVRFTVEKKEFILQLDTYELTRAPVLSEEEKSRLVPQVAKLYGFDVVMEVLSPDGRWFAGIKDHNIYLRSTYDGRSVQLTKDGIEDYEWGRDWLGPVALWSPDSFKVAVKKLDYRKVPEAHLPVDSGVIEYEMRTELFIIDVRSQKRVRVEPGSEPGEEVRIVGWRRDGSELVYRVMDRAVKQLDLRAANATSGATRVILSERQDTFVIDWGWKFQQYDVPAVRFQLLTHLDDGERFIWRSERDGWNHLYLYRLDGTLVRRLTTGSFPVVQVEAVNERQGWVYFTASGDRRRPYDLHLYRVTLEGRGFQQLTKQPGQHAVEFSPSRKYYLDTHSAPDRPPVVELRRANGQLRQVLSMANVDALAALKWRPPDQFVVKAADGRTDLHGLLYKPYDFDPRKRYPVVEHIYGGPHISLMGLFWGGNRFIGWWGAVQSQALAQLGFIVFSVDGRGTPDRGKAFQDFGHGAMGLYNIPDHVAVLRGLAKERPYMDLGRVGVFGHSYGGYMVLRAMLTAPDVYHVGFASDAFVELGDIRTYNSEGRNYIRYLGWLEENPDAYARLSVLPLATNLKGKLLLSYGEGHYAQQAAKMVNALTEAGKPFDVLPPLPGQDHFLNGIYGTRVDEARRKYFQEHLKP